MGITMLRLKLDCSDDDQETLRLVGSLCRKARNVGIEDWLLRQRGMPPSAKQAAPPQPRRVRGNNGEIVLRKRETSDESTKIYHAMTEAVEELDTRLVSSLSREITKELNAKVDWRKNGCENKKRRKRDDILEYEQRPPFSQCLKIPVVASCTQLQYGPQTEVRLKLLRGSAESIRIKTAALGPRLKQKLLEISEGHRRLQDSSIHYRHEKRCWFWHLPITEDPAETLDETVEIVLMPACGDPDKPSHDRPFHVGNWYIGDGRYLLSQLERIIASEKEIGYAYRHRRTGTGHGRQKRTKAIAKKRLQRRHQIEEFRRRLIVDVLRQCQRANAGRLIYRRPSLPLREKSWFSRHGIDWDWTRFETDLKNSASKYGVAVKVKQLNMKEWKTGADQPDET